MEVNLSVPNPRLDAYCANKGTCYDIAIIGGGVAGLSAGIYAARDGFKTLVLEGSFVSAVDFPGGSLMLTPKIENYPGFIGGAGEDLIDVMHTQAENFGAKIKDERVETFIPNGTEHKLHVIITDEGTTYKARAVIIATGSVPKMLGLEREAEFIGQGISTCATCDALFYEDKTVTVIGGGDTAVEDALILANHASKVNMLVRRDKLKASGPEVKDILNHPNINILWETQATSLKISDGKITGLNITHHVNGENNIETDGVFIAVGTTPSTEFLKNTEIELDEEGHILVKGDSTQVKSPYTGIFAAGDVVDKIYKQAITSAGKGAQAALEARTFLSH